MLNPILNLIEDSASLKDLPKAHVLLALGRSLKEAESSIRLSIGLSTSSKDIEQAIHILTNTIKSLR